MGTVVFDEGGQVAEMLLFLDHLFATYHLQQFYEAGPSGRPVTVCTSFQIFRLVGNDAAQWPGKDSRP